MLVLAPAACIMAGIALSAAFDTMTGSIKFQPISPSPSPVPSEKVTLPIQHCTFLLTFLRLFLKSDISMLIVKIHSGLYNCLQV